MILLYQLLPGYDDKGKVNVSRKALLPKPLKKETKADAPKSE